MKRRRFLTSTTAALAGSVLTHRASAAAGKRPNILFIITDQQSSTLMSCAGNRWLQTPAMDYLAANGIRFGLAYSTNPVCCPARIGFMTGRFPGTFQSRKGDQVRENGGGMAVANIPPEVPGTHVAAYLTKAGYDLAYAGKVHLPKPLHPKTLGFNCLTGDQRDDCARQCAAYIKGKHERPFYLVASFINPHDICFYAINDYRFDAGATRKGRGGVANQRLLEAMQLPPDAGEDTFFAKHCPPLPANHAPQANEPKAVLKLLAIRGFRANARRNYTDKDWRLHRWAYHRLAERVDRQIQVVLDALRQSGQEENTVVIFTSDHGDMDSAHKMEHKTAPYEEAARIPFLVMHKGTAPAGRVDQEHLVSNGLDLLPTVCDYAGIPDAKADPRGRSLRPLIEGRPVAAWRQTVGVESQIGRMVVGHGVKYVRYDFAGKEERLIDLRKDPGETRHVTGDPAYADVLTRMRTAYDTEWFPQV